MEWIKFEDEFPDKKKHKEIITFEKITNIKTKKKLNMICIEETKSIHKDKDGFWSDAGGDNLTHWMPLPDAPKE